MVFLQNDNDLKKNLIFFYNTRKFYIIFAGARELRV